MMEHEERLTQAYQAALDRYQFVFEEAFPATASLEVLHMDEFVALARPIRDGIEVVVSSGVFDAVQKTWRKALVFSDSLPEENRFNVGHVDDAIDASLTWLMLHELYHFEAGHLGVMGAAGISETCISASLGLTKRSKTKSNPLDEFEQDQALAIQRCFELQADHYAFETMIEHYSDDVWDYVSFYMACAVAVMVLIDREDSVEELNRTHPTATARTFQLFALLITHWQPSPNSDQHMPDADEVNAYYRKVIAPAISDYSNLATAIGATSIIYSQKDVDNLFADIETLQIPREHRTQQLRTDGAIEYDELMPTNSLTSTLLSE